MSTRLLCQGFGIRGYQYVNAEYGQSREAAAKRGSPGNPLGVVFDRSRTTCLEGHVPSWPPGGKTPPTPADSRYVTQKERQGANMTSYEQYEKDCNRIRKENKDLLNGFKKWLSGKKLSKKTIDKHVLHVDFYINEFLLYEDATRAADGVGRIGMFLGYWFIRKAMWASKTAIKENAASLIKFYAFLLERKQIPEESFEYLKERIKADMPEWTATMERYDDPDIEDPAEIWGL